MRKNNRKAGGVTTRYFSIPTVVCALACDSANGSRSKGNVGEQIKKKENTKRDAGRDRAIWILAGNEGAYA